MQDYRKIIQEIEDSLKNREVLKKNIWEWDKKYVLGVGLPKLGIAFESGKGAIIRDFEGKQYLDFMGQLKEIDFLLHLNARGDTVNLGFTPPLCINTDDVDRGMSILKEALGKVC